MSHVATTARRFRDRRDAGHQLAQRLDSLRLENPVILGLTRGGVPVAAEVARTLRAPLDVIVVRKLGVPTHRELAFGAVGEDGVEFINTALVQRLGISDEQIAEVRTFETDELHRRLNLYRHVRPALDLKGRTAIVVDDGLATGATARVACRVANAHGAARVVLAVPVASREALGELGAYADEVVSVLIPLDFSAVGQWYDDFDQCDDAQVIDLLRASADVPWS